MIQIARKVTQAEEAVFTQRIQFLLDATPKEVGIAAFFRLDESSKIEEIFQSQNAENIGGDVGGSNNPHSIEEEDQ